MFVSADDCIILSDDYADGLKIMSGKKSKRNDSDVLMGRSSIPLTLIDRKTKDKSRLDVISRPVLHCFVPSENDLSLY